METSPIIVPLRLGESSLIDGTTVCVTGSQRLQVISQTGFGDYRSTVDVKGNFATGHYIPDSGGNPTLEIIVYETIL